MPKEQVCFSLIVALFAVAFFQYVRTHYDYAVDQMSDTLAVAVEPTKPIEGQKTGTSGLRKQVRRVRSLCLRVRGSLTRSWARR